MIKKCLVCGKDFSKLSTCSKTSWEKVKFCSHQCYWESLKGKPSSFKKERARVCERCGKEYISNRRGKDWQSQKFCSHKCQPNPFLGRHHTEEANEKNRLAHIGTSTWNKGICGENHHGWKGGLKAARVRHKAKRRQLGFIPLNNCKEDGWVGHHIDRDYVIFIPEELHKSTSHSVLKNTNMNIINDKVYNWLAKEYGTAVRTSDE